MLKRYTAVLFVAILLVGRSYVCNIGRAGTFVRPSTRTPFRHRQLSSPKPSAIQATSSLQLGPIHKIASQTINHLQLIAYDTAYADKQETLFGRFMDHKVMKFLTYPVDELYLSFGLLIVWVVFLRSIRIGDTILSLFRIKKSAGANLEKNIQNAAYVFSGMRKTEEEKQKQLLANTEKDVVSARDTSEVLECEKCRMQMMPAKGRAAAILDKPSFRCARCGSKAAAYFDIHNLDDPRAVARLKRLENEELGLDADGNEL